MSATAKCSCGFGDGEALAKIDYNSMSRITGRDETIIRTAYLWGQTDNSTGWSYYVSATSGLGFPEADSEIDLQRKRQIFWESTVILLGEPNPLLTIDANGTIVAKTRNVYVRAYNPGSNSYSGLLGVGDTIGAGNWIVVGDLLYDEEGKIHLEANDTDPNSEILGNAGEVQIKHTWDYVKITNLSSRLLVVNDINVVLLDTNPIEEVALDNVYDDNTHSFPDELTDPATPRTTARWTGAALSDQTYDFDIIHKFAPTQVEISVEGPNNPSDLWLDGDIENPIGRTEITNSRGGIFSDNASDLDDIESLGVDSNLVATFDRPGPDGDYELIRTNQFFVYAPNGSIGRQLSTAPPRVPVAVELIRFVHIDPEYYPLAYNPDPLQCENSDPTCLFEIQIQAEARGDLVLDITGNERSLTSAPSAIDWQVDYLLAGNDIDVVINDTIQGDDVPDLNGLDVRLFTPPNGLGENPPAGDAYHDMEYLYHFRPDLPAVDYSTILRAFGLTERVDVESTYTFGDAGTEFGDVKAGDDIKICHVSTRNYRHAADFGSAQEYPCDTRDPGTLDFMPAPSNAIVHFVIWLDVAWDGPYSTPFELDDGIGTDVAQIFLLTNGDITATELVGDMLVGSIHSTQGDVTLYSPGRIVDSDAVDTIDVAGDNITMTAGLATAEGGIGNPTNFLEIDTRFAGIAETGVLTADDLASDDALTPGIYLDEIVGLMPVNVVTTAGNDWLTTGNVSLRTVNGSIIDVGILPDEVNVSGQTIDIDANGGSIGEYGNDLDIDSARGPPGLPCDNENCGDYVCATEDCSDRPLGVADLGLTNDGLYAADDVALEATDSIYLTETDSYLRLLLAHAVNGNIRLTVNETSDLDEDLYLIKSGTARFAESDFRLPSSDPDAPRDIPVGQIFAENADDSGDPGWVLLRVGDDVATHQNSEILAAGSIDIFGDYLNLDPGDGDTTSRRHVQRLGHDDDPAGSHHRRLHGRTAGAGQWSPGRNLHADHDRRDARSHHPDLGQRRHRPVPVRRCVGHPDLR